MSTHIHPAIVPARCCCGNMDPASVSIRSQIYGELSYTDTIPEQLTEFLLPGARPIAATCRSGALLIQEIKTAGLTLWHHTVLLREDDTFLISAQQPMLSLNFCLQNSFFLCRRDSKEQLTFHEGQYNMSFFAKLDLIAEFGKEKPYCFLTIFYSPESLSKCATVYPFLASFLEETEGKEEALLCSVDQFVNKPVKKILLSLLQGECKEEETDLFIKRGKMLELLVKVIEQTPPSSTSGQTILNKQDVEKIYEARAWLSLQINRPVTLYELAKKVGMNVHKLSTGFHKITGTTVFHFHRRIRMVRAVQLLEETDRDLFDVGTEVGYTDGKTFSKEFKKEKGIPPLEYRRQMRLQQDAKS